MSLRRGFNLLEVVLALGLLSFILLSIMGVFLTAGASGSYGRASVDAVNLAERELYSWKAKDFVELEALVGNPQVYQLSHKNKDYDVEISAARLSANVADPEYRMLNLSTNLTWQEKKSLAQDENQSAVQETQTQFRLDTVVSGTGQF